MVKIIQKVKEKSGTDKLNNCLKVHIKFMKKMTCDFMSFLAVFQSYQDDGGMIMRHCAMELRLWLSRFRLKQGLNSSR